MNILIRTHLLCPYSDCVAHERKNTQRIQVAVDEQRKVKLSQTVKGKANKTKLSYEYKKWIRPSKCSYCNKLVEVVIDETHVTRYIYLRMVRYSQDS